MLSPMYLPDPLILMPEKDQYTSLTQIKNQLLASPTLVAFLKDYKNELFVLLNISSFWTTQHTKKSLLALLSAEQSKLSLAVQSKFLQAGLADGKLVPLKSSLDWKKKEEIAKINYLPMILQLACSHPEYYFNKNFESKVSHSELIDSVVIDPNKIPQWFLDAFHIDAVDEDAGNVKELFKKARPLEYHKEKPAKTWRVVFIEGKLVVFRELQQLLHKETEGLTSWEKKRVDYKKYFNSYDDIYSALRSQYYIVDKEDDKIESYKDFQKDALELLYDIKYETKQGSEKRKLDDIIAEVSNATSFYVAASKFYNLFKIDFVNKSIDADHLQGASNKMSKELWRLRNIILEIQVQSDALQQLLDAQKYPLEVFHNKLAMASHKQDKIQAYVSAFYAYGAQLDRLAQKTEPFVSLEKEVSQVFLPLAYKSSLSSIAVSIRVETLVALQRMRLRVYELEHKIKLWIVTQADFSFANCISTKYPELYQSFFWAIDGYVENIQRFAFFQNSKEDVEDCLFLLQKLKTLPDREENIQTLSQFTV